MSKLPFPQIAEFSNIPGAPREQGNVEYVLLLSLVAIAMIPALALFSQNISDYTVCKFVDVGQNNSDSALSLFMIPEAEYKSYFPDADPSSARFAEISVTPNPTPSVMDGNNAE